MSTTRHGLRLYGHRGAPAHLPENTLPAFERALSDIFDQFIACHLRNWLGQDMFAVAQDGDPGFTVVERGVSSVEGLADAEGLQPGDWVEVEVTAADEYDLWAKAAE